MDGEKGLGMITKILKLIISYKRQVNVESYDHICPEGTQKRKIK